MTLIYRVQHKRWLWGMYSGGNAAAQRMCEAARHPEPENDGALMRDFMDKHGFDAKSSGVPHCYKYGFKDLAQMRSWVYHQEIREQLHELGYHIAVIDAEDVVSGDTQAVYNTARNWVVMRTLDVRTMEE